MLSRLLVALYRFWHGRLHRRGAGRLLNLLAPHLSGLHAYRLTLPEGHTVPLDFRDVSAMYWLNHSLGDPFEERGLASAIGRLVHANSVIWDVGANAGLLSYLLARRHPPAELHLFEPNPRVHALAAAALRTFAFAACHQCALSSHAGQKIFTLPEGGSTTGTLEPVRTGRAGRGFTVTCHTADGWLAEHSARPPAIIKIDTEGHELSVLAGMANLISAHRPVIFLEHLSLSDDEVSATVPAGYALHSVGDEDGSLTPGLDRSRGHNVALIPSP